MEVYLGCIVKLDDEGKRTNEFVAELDVFFAKDGAAAHNAMRFVHHDAIKEAGGSDEVEVLIRPFCS